MSGFQPERGSDAWEQERAEQQIFEPGSKAWHLARRRNHASRPWYSRKRVIIPAGFCGILLLLTMIPDHPSHGGYPTDAPPSISSAGLETAERPMGFEECNRQIRTLADDLGTPINIVDSSAMRTVRFPAADGSVLVTCDALDAKMIIVKSATGS